MTYNLTDELYLITDMLITADWNAPSSDRWTVPVGGGIGRSFNIGKQAMNTNLQGYWNAVTPDGGPEWSVFFTLQFLFPK